MGRWTYDRTGQTCPAAAQMIDFDPGFRSVVDLGANPDDRAMATLIGILNFGATPPNQIVQLVR
eukprot:3658320-Amphidinium_carterae.1